MQVYTNHPDTRSLSDLMAIYESNYIRLANLINEDMPLLVDLVFRVEGLLDLHVEIIERTRFTTIVHMTYIMREGAVLHVLPDIKIRIYHDARLAEVLSCGRRRGNVCIRYDRTREQYDLSRIWEMNRFLQKWLGYCFRQGYQKAMYSIEKG